MGMNMLRKKSLVVVQLLLVALSLLVAGCGNDTAQTNPDPQAAYVQAVLDSSLVTPAKIYQGLTPITNDNPQLIWENGVV
ncbi:hypothetical protein, partial [Trichlorobacter lovleyi]